MTWHTVTLGDVCLLVNGKAYNAQDWATEGTPIIRIQNLNGVDKPFNHWNGPIDNEVQVKDDDILLAWSGTPGTSFGAHIWRRGRGVLNQHIFRLDIDRQKITGEWAVTCINHQLHKLIGQAHGGVGLQHVTKPMVQGLRIPLPPLPEQRRIAAILDKADAIRRKRQELVRLTEELLRSTFMEMFGDPVANSKEWPILLLDQISSDMTYGTSTKCGEVAAASLPVLRIPNIIHGQINWRDLKYASLERKEVDQLLLKPGDLLFVRTNGNPEYIGRCAMFTEARQALFASYLIRVQLRSDAPYRPEFLRYVATMPSYRSLLVAEARTTAGNYNISTQGLRRLKLIAPPVPQQNKFLKFASECSAIQEKRLAAFTESESLFGSLVQRAFRGEL